MAERAPGQSDAALSRALRRQWEAAGRPPCRICQTSITDDEVSYASQVWKAVVHRLCSGVIGTSPSQAVECAELHLTYNFCAHPGFCPCPRSSAINAIVAARRMGLATIEVATAGSPGCERAAREAGLGTSYKHVPLRESLQYGQIAKQGGMLDEKAWNKPSTWYEPPERLTVDVHRSIREGRITAWMPKVEA